MGVGKKGKSHVQIQGCQTAVNFQCFCNLRCAFRANESALSMINLGSDYKLRKKRKYHLQMQFGQSIVDF